MKLTGIAILLFFLSPLAHAQQLPKTNDGVGRPAFRGARAIKSYKQTINAPPDRVFPLICPIREAEWSDGWIGKVVYAASGYAEEDGVYATEHGQKYDTIWLITKRDIGNHEIEFVYFIPGIRVTRLTVTVKGIGNMKSSIYIKYITTGLSEEGNREIIDGFTDLKFNKRMAEWERAMNYFVETGKLLKEKH